MKKSAVEWIEGYLKNFNDIQDNLRIRKAFEQAKEMEKKQVIDVYRKYRNTTILISITISIIIGMISTIIILLNK